MHAGQIKGSGHFDIQSRLKVRMNNELNFKPLPSASPFFHSQHRLSLFSLCCARTPLPTLFALPHITQALLFCCTFPDMPKSQRCSSESGEGALGSVPPLGNTSCHGLCQFSSIELLSVLSVYTGLQLLSQCGKGTRRGVFIFCVVCYVCVPDLFFFLKY